ncbi:3-hydroxypropionyl-coenzyme A dehydratase [Sarcoptes scabiei]|uniref:3-hydroxypropionyl-coenzyme A dehydratase n=1 Tax=Sarcoptes scabiei TaxID=52283 RepID=A0A834RE39_SARSC|nr:3-hydroxypropionyl-coenzyme A dehydratase [Sarcoptes scabiei]
MIATKANCYRYLSSRNIRTFLIQISKNHSTFLNKDSVVVEKRTRGIRLIGLNRPEKRNAINSTVANKLRIAIEEFENDNDYSVAILHGFGGSFCAGLDLEEIADSPAEELGNLVKPIFESTEQMFCSKPVIAAIDGYAVAEGFELALWCDLRVIETDAIIGFFCRRFGVPLINGSSIRLSKMIGYSRALDLILTGRGINGKEAFEMGLANRLVPVGTALGQAFNLAQSLVKFPQECLRVDRRSLYYATFQAKTLEEASKFEIENAAEIIKDNLIKVNAQRFREGVGKHGKFVLDKVNHEVDITV